jgi:hypothetical protein
LELVEPVIVEGRDRIPFNASARCDASQWRLVQVCQQPANPSGVGCRRAIDQTRPPLRFGSLDQKHGRSVGPRIKLEITRVSKRQKRNYLVHPKRVGQ